LLDSAALDGHFEHPVRGPFGIWSPGTSELFFNSLPGWHRIDQPLTMVPPFGCRTCPVMYEESCEARNK